MDVHKYSLRRRHDHSHMVGGDTSVGTIDVTWFPQFYWILVGSVVAAFTLVNIINQFTYRQRIWARRRGNSTPAKPTLLPSKVYATVTALAREVGNATLPAFQVLNFVVLQPTFGAVLLMIAYAIMLVVLCFYAIDWENLLVYQNIGYRTGYVNLAQLPLVFLLAGKNNVIGWLTGSSYERLNWIHRWVARGLLLTVTLHMAYWFADWAPFEDYISTMMATDVVAKQGLVAWCILLWIVISSMAPIRGWSYEFFVVQHAISYIALVTLIFLHIPSHDHNWLWTPVAIYFFDKTIRTFYFVYTNLSVFHRNRSRDGSASKLWTLQAEMTPLPHDVTRIRIENPPIKWNPGQHAFLACHSVVPLQSHPFTISSLPHDNALEFHSKARTGGTKRFFDYAEKQVGLPSSEKPNGVRTISVAIDGPYGRIRPLRQFDSVVLLAGSTGATFTVPLARDLVRQWDDSRESSTGSLSWLQAPHGIVTRNIRFVWVAKSLKQFAWFTSQLNEIVENVNQLRSRGAKVQLDVTLYVTCDESLTEDWNTSTVIHQSSKINNSATGDPKSLVVLNDGNSSSEISSTESLTEKPNGKQIDAGEGVDVHEVSSRSDIDGGNPPGGIKTCQPDGTCCCTMTVHEDSISSSLDRNAPVCNCNCSSAPAHSPSTSLQEETKPTSSSTTRLLHPDIRVVSGRPHIRSTIRRSLEQARGESAVIACGPKGLNNDARRAVVNLSDERAIHKGTGAQGVWFHAEGFGY